MPDHVPVLPQPASTAVHASPDELHDVWLVCDDVFAVQQYTHHWRISATQGTLLGIPVKRGGVGQGKGGARGWGGGQEEGGWSTQPNQVHPTPQHPPSQLHT
jgi:hypothetical protein